MKDFAKRFYELDQFLGCYFHQDWKIVLDWQGETPTFEAAVRHFKAKNLPDYVAEVAIQLRQFLALSLNDDDIETTLDQANVAYNPRARGLTERQWLEKVLEILKEPSEHSHAMRVIG